MYGNHKTCSDWCMHKEVADLFKELPYKKALCDAPLKKSLEQIVNQCKEKADKLAFLGSTQANESLDLTIATKALFSCI